MSADCIFCKIIAGQIPSKKAYEDEHCYAFHDINPQAPTHILIVPKKHIYGVQKATDDDAQVIGHLIVAAGKLARERGIEESGYRTVFNAGVDAGQTVFHLHLHLIGGRPLGWPPG